jgi:hypothetical protein
MVMPLRPGKPKKAGERPYLIARVGLNRSVLLHAAASAAGYLAKVVAGACFVLIVRRSSTFPLSIAARAGVRKVQAIVAGDTC